MKKMSRPVPGCGGVQRGRQRRQRRPQAVGRQVAEAEPEGALALAEPRPARELQVVPRQQRPEARDGGGVERVRPQSQAAQRAASGRTHSTRSRSPSHHAASLSSASARSWRRGASTCSRCCNRTVASVSSSTESEITVFILATTRRDRRSASATVSQPVRRPGAPSAFDGGADTIYCSSFSKSLAPGYRIGWIATRVHAQQVMERKMAFSLCGPLLPQAALADFLAGGSYDAHLRRMHRTFEENLARMSRAVEASFPPETKVSRPAGGFVLWLELPSVSIRAPCSTRRSNMASASRLAMSSRRAGAIATACA